MNDSTLLDFLIDQQAVVVMGGKSPGGIGYWLYWPNAEETQIGVFSTAREAIIQAIRDDS